MSEGYAKHSRPEEKKSGPVRKILKFIGAVLLIAVLLFAGLIGFLSATEYKPADSDEIAVEGEASEDLAPGDEFTVMSWNIGYGALGDNADFFMDVEFVKIQIEENNTDSCRVRAVIRNNSTVPFDNNIEIFATINGGDRLRSLYPRFSYSIPETGGIKHLDFKQRVNYTEGSINGRYLHIPKSPTRDYVGSGYFTIPVTQADPNNDQSTVVEVVNYFESIPTADNPQPIRRLHKYRILHPIWWQCSILRHRHGWPSCLRVQHHLS